MNDLDSFSEWNREVANRSQSMTEMISASIANTITEGIYKLHKARKLNSSDEKKMLDEFMNTENSKAFFYELIYMDSKYFLMRNWNFIYESFEKARAKSLGVARKKGLSDPDNTVNGYFKRFGVFAFDGLFESFDKSLKIYSIAIAKHLDLFTEPIYDGLEEYNDMDALSAIQEAILEFPYDRTYYEKYIEFGGEITDDLKTFAALNMIDIDDIYQNHLEEIKAKKALKEELERAEAERIRQEEERKLKAVELVKEKFGKIGSEHFDIFAQLSENPLFLEYSDREITNHLEISGIVFEYLDRHYKDKYISMYSVRSDKFKSKQRKLMSVYGFKTVSENNALFFYDNTIFGGAKEGFVLTNNALCYKNILASPCVVDINTIKSLTVKESHICINNAEEIECSAGIGLEVITNILIFCICNLLTLQSTNTQTAVNVMPVQAQAPNTSQQTDDGSWVCQCGAKNLTTSKFCTQCGTKKAEENSKWVCLNCNAENLPTAKFCSQCGNAKP